MFGARTRPTLLAAGLVVIMAGTACSVEQTTQLPYCDRPGSGLIAAQSVPGAHLLPCIGTLPAGWTPDTVAVDQDGMRVTLDSDRAGAGAARLRFEASCDTGGAVAVPSEQEGADQFELVEQVEPAFRSRRYYVFAGGCVWWEFDFAEGAPSALSIELAGQITLLSRDALNDILRETFVDEDL